jgi:predicted HAD superfamily hydrolase
LIQVPSGEVVEPEQRLGIATEHWNPLVQPSVARAAAVSPWLERARRSGAWARRLPRPSQLQHVREKVSALRWTLRWPNLERLASDLSGYTVLSLDVFDTAIVRLVANPLDIFSVVERDYLQANPALAPFDFRQERILAEKRAGLSAWQHRRSEDPTLDDIYAAMALPPGWVRHELHDLEIDAERNLTRADPVVQEIYSTAIRLGLIVVFISDMYLPEEVINTILADNGYQVHSGLFVSGTRGVSKRSGRLFDLVEAKLGIDSTNMLHIGDNHFADVAVARDRGWRAEYWARSLGHRSDSTEPGSIDESIRSRLVRADRVKYKEVDEELCLWDRLGYEVAGPLFFGFVQWIAEQAETNGREHVFFLARDGWILKQLYERLNPPVPASYLYASRRCLGLPAIRCVNGEALDFLTSHAHCELSVSAYLDRVGLSADEHGKLIRSAGFASASDVVRAPEDFKQLRTVFRALETEVLRRARSERVTLEAYFAQAGLLSSQKVGIVDLGWKGSLQRSLAATLEEMPGRPRDLVGYYLGTIADAASVANDGHDLRGFLMNFDEPECWSRLVYASVGLLEFLHSAPHGSVVNFSDSEDAIVPVMAPHDLSDEALLRVKVLQDGALRFASDLIPIVNRHSWLRLPPEVAAGPTDSLLRCPTLEEARTLGDMTHTLGLGAVTTPSHLAKPPSLREFLREPPSLLGRYRTSLWKAGYRRRVVVPAPIFRLVEALLDRSGRRGRTGISP